MSARNHSPPPVFSQPTKQRLIVLWNDGLPLNAVLTQLKDEFGILMSQAQAHSILAKARRRAPKTVKRRHSNAIFVPSR